MRARLVVEEATSGQWQRAVDECPWATFFQTPQWYGAAAPLLRHHALRLWRVGEGESSAVLPFFERRTRRFLRTRVDRRANAAGVYGGWVGARPLDDAMTNALVTDFAHGASTLQLRLNPFHPAPPLPDVGRGAHWKPETTHVIPLDGGLEPVLAGYASGQRRNLKAAQKAGVTCRPARTDDWPRYLDLYHRTLERWGDDASMRYRDDLLLRFSGLPREQATLWLAERGDVLGAGVLAFYHRHHVVLWHSANDAAENEHYPLKLLLHEILIDALARKVRIFDLNPSGGHEGPSMWKRLLGAQERPAPVLERGLPAKRVQAPAAQAPAV